MSRQSCALQSVPDCRAEIYESIKASMDMLAPGGGYCFAGGYLGAIGDTRVMHKNEMVMRAYGELCTRYYGG